MALVAAYCGQELIEGWLAAGHPAGVAGVLEHGGWIALVCAPLVGGLVALAARGAAAATEPRAARLHLEAATGRHAGRHLARTGVPAFARPPRTLPRGPGPTADLRLIAQSADTSADDETDRGGLR